MFSIVLAVMAVIMPCIWYYEPLFAGKVFCTDDLMAQYYPWWTFMAESIRSGSWPLWNTHVFCGMPYYTNPETSMYYPLKLPFMFLPFSLSAGIVRVLDAVVASVGMFLLLRRYGMCLISAVCGAVMFTYGSFMQYEFVHIPYINTASWTPLILYILLKLVDKPCWRTAACLALAEMCSFLGGSPVVFLLSNMGIAVFWLFYVMDKCASDVFDGVQVLKCLLGAVALFCMLATVVVLPVGQFIALSSRAHGVADAVSYFNYSLPFNAIHTFLLPALHIAYGAPYQPLHPVYFTSVPYVGMLAPMLAIFSLLALYRGRVGLPALVCVLFGCLMALGVNTGLFSSVLNALPFLKWFRWPNDFMLLAYLGLAISAAAGIDTLIKLNRRRYVATSLIFASYLGLSVYSLGILSPWQVVAISSCMCLLLYAVKYRHIVSPLSKRNILMISTCVIGVLCIDLYWYGSRYRIFADADDVSLRHMERVNDIVLMKAAGGRVSFGDSGWQVYFKGQEGYAAGKLPLFGAATTISNWPSLGKWLRLVRKDKLDNRIQLQQYVFGDIVEWSKSYPVNLAMIRGYDEISVYDPFHLKDVEKLFASVPVETVWDVCGVKCVVRPAGIKAKADAVYDDGVYCILENQDCLPFISIMHEVTQIEGLDGIISLMQSPGFDPRKKVAVSGWNPRAIEIPSVTDKTSQASVLLFERKPGRISFAVDMKYPGFAVVNDAFYPGWKAYVDGQPQEIIKANGIFRSVYLAKGRHKVEMVFRPVLYYVSAMVTVVGLLLSLVILVPMRRGRRVDFQ